MTRFHFISVLRLYYVINSHKNQFQNCFELHIIYILYKSSWLNSRYWFHLPAPWSGHLHGTALTVKLPHHPTLGWGIPPPPPLLSFWGTFLKINQTFWAIMRIDKIRRILSILRRKKPVNRTQNRFCWQPITQAASKNNRKWIFFFTKTAMILWYCDKNTRINVKQTKNCYRETWRKKIDNLNFSSTDLSICLGISF